ncbi:MAG: chromate transporter [Anaerorhabdus sp.]
MMILLQLFISFCKVGLFTIGGGYASLPLIQNEVIQVHQWIDIVQFTDLITISQMTPGPIAINTATFVGNIIAGIPGSIIATIGSVLPSVIIVLMLTKVYFRYKDLSFMNGILSGLRPAVAALIGSAGISITLNSIGVEASFVSFKQIDFIAVFLFIFAFTILRKWRVNPIIVMLSTGLIGTVIYLI